MPELVLALDVGGTFTDIVLARRGAPEFATAKTPSTPDDPSRGFLDGVDKILRAAGAAGGDVAAVLHGSTVATNAILEGRGAVTGMLVTDGFRYVLEIGRHDIPRKENLYAWVKPKRPVPPRRIFEVSERVLVDGSVERDLDEEGVRVAARAMRAVGVESVAVVFLHAYLRPDHERRAARILEEELPGVSVSLSSEVLPVFREYERSVATVLNAYVQPIVGRYIARLGDGLALRGIAAPLLIMKSNGGVFGPRQAARQALHMALSGPAAGVRGAALVGALAGARDAITIDIGGTSADVSLIVDGRLQTTLDGEIGPFPLGMPIADIHTIGAGGGSIAQVTAQGGLAVGPQSAGADPGPACYGRGGERPTVTDANLLLGRIPPHLLDGEIPLDPALAERAIRLHVAGPLGMSVTAAADGILRLVNANMVGALKVVSVEKGFDPRRFALIAFGGAGPMQAGDLARLIGTPRLVVPRHPGLLCAIGLLAADLRLDLVRTCLRRAPDYDLPGLAATWHDLEAAAVAQLDREGVPPDRRAVERLADLRYARQGFELTVEMGGGPIDPPALDRLLARFHALHEQLYTFADRAAPVEIVNLRVRATGRTDAPAPPRIAAAAPGARPEPAGTRRVCYDGSGFSPVPVYRRERLRAGEALAGPAIVDQADTTTVLLPGQTARVDAWGNLLVE